MLVTLCVDFSRDGINVSGLVQNIRVTAEALARQVFNLSEDGDVDIFSEGLVCFVVSFQHSTA